MKLAPYFYTLAILAVVKPGLAKPAPAKETNVMYNQTSINNMLQGLLHFDISSATQEQKDLLDRIMNKSQNCVNTNKTICLIDSMLRNISKDLVEDGVTNASKQLDNKKFDQFFGELLNKLDKNTLAAYSPYTDSNNKLQTKDSYSLSTDREFRSYFRLTQELNSMLINPDKFSPSEIVSPFIISDPLLREEAIRKLTDSPSFQLHPLNEDGKFHEMLEKIKEEILNADGGSDFDGSITLELDQVLGLDASPLPELNSTDITNATAIIDQSNGTLFSHTDDTDKLILINAILRSLLGDLLDVILDLPDRIIGSGRGLLAGKDGLTITISLGGKKQGSQNDGSDNSRNNDGRITNGRTTNDRNTNGRSNNNNNNNSNNNSNNNNNNNSNNNGRNNNNNNNNNNPNSNHNIGRRPPTY